VEDEFKKLDRMIGALLSTRSSKILRSPVAQARTFGVQGNDLDEMQRYLEACGAFDDPEEGKLVIPDTKNDL
jgi:hypothetical protein